MSPPVSGVADVRRGQIVLPLDGDHDVLVDFASIVPELFAEDRAVWAALVLERAHAHAAPVGMEELVLVTRATVHVAQRLPSDPTRVLLTVGAWTENVGTVLAVARARMRELERKP